SITATAGDINLFVTDALAVTGAVTATGGGVLFSANGITLGNNAAASTITATNSLDFNAGSGALALGSQAVNLVANSGNTASGGRRVNLVAADGIGSGGGGLLNVTAGNSASSGLLVQARPGSGKAVTLGSVTGGSLLIPSGSPQAASSIALGNVKAFTGDVTLTANAITAGDIASRGQVSMTLSGVATASLGAVKAGGTVQIKADGRLMCEATLAGGEASCSVPELSLGNHNLVATYLGSKDYATSVSQSLMHYVDRISLDDNKTSTSFSAIGQFDNHADTAPFTYTLETSGRVCSAVNGADNDSFSVTGNTLQRASAAKAGTYTICVQSTDANAGLIQAVFSIIITEPPSMVGAGLDHNSVNTKQTEVGKFQAQGGQKPYVFGLQNSGAVCKSDNSSGNQYFAVVGNQLNIVPGTAVGTYPICFEVTDLEGEKAQKTATISVTAAPEGVNLSHNKVSTNQTVVGTLSMADGQEPILYALADSGKVCNDTNAADNGDFNTLNDQLQLNPGSAAGVRSICVQSTDVNNTVLQQDFSIYVTEPPSALTLSNTSLTVAQSLVGTLGTVDGQRLFDYKLANSGNVCNADNGGDNLSFRVLGNGLLRQPETPAGKYSICLQSTDANGGSIQQDFEISVSADTGGNPEWVAQVSSSKLINGDGPGTVVGQATSSIENARFEITDLAHFPFGALFKISPTGTITFVGTADDATEPYYPIRILVVAPDGSSRTLDTVIEVMRDGLKVGDLGVDDRGKVVRGGKVEIDVLANDVLGSHANRWISHEIVQYPQNGKAWVGSIFYQSNKQFIGKDYLTYRACDNLRYCVMATLRIDVQAPFIPETGFSPNQKTELPKQAAWQAFQQASGLRISIAKLGLDTEIVGVPKNGDTWEVDWLGNSVGWLQGTAFPTWNGNSVITGHNTNPEGLPGTFAGLSVLSWNDEVVILYQGSRYVYQVREVSPRLPADRLDNVTEHREGAWITLVTCAGFDASTNSYLYRYVVRAMLVRVE
ncbi:MAG: sortase, partial [Chloroflexota bacterium]